MLTAYGLPLLDRLDHALTRLHRYLRRWQAVLHADDWTQIETAHCHCDGAA